MDIKFIKQIPFFGALSDEKAEVVLKAFRMKSFAPGDIIFKQDALGDGMYGIIFGEVEVIRNDEVIAKIGNNGFFGEMALIAAEPRSATIKVLSDLSVFFLSKEAFDQITLALGDDVKADILSRIQEDYS